MNGEIFVFGSNLAGRHGAGAALVARQSFGAKMGQGEGLMIDSVVGGRSYAIPTKDERLRVLPLSEVAQHIQRFVCFAQENRLERFFITRVGCGLAGYKNSDIAPLFSAMPRDRSSVAREWASWFNHARVLE